MVLILAKNMSMLTGGLADILSKDKVIDADTDTDIEHVSKVVKLRFTRKQYDAFRNACIIFQVVSADSKFVDFVKSVLGSDVKIPTIAKQFVQPILEAPVRIPLKISKETSETTTKNSYFTAPTQATEKCLELYEHVKDKDINFKQDINEGTTCVTDVRVLMSKYILENELRDEQGVVLDDFICKLASSAVSNCSDKLMRIEGSLVIPKGDRKVMTDIINEITFGK